MCAHPGKDFSTPEYRHQKDAVWCNKISESKRYGELILSLKNDYMKQHRNYPRTLIGMYRLMVVFELTGATPVAGGRNKCLNFGNVVANSKVAGNRDPISGGSARRKLECWKCGGEHLKRNFPKPAEEKDKTKKDNGGEWQAWGADNKCVDGETYVKG